MIRPSVMHLALLIAFKHQERVSTGKTWQATKQLSDRGLILQSPGHVLPLPLKEHCKGHLSYLHIPSRGE